MELTLFAFGSPTPLAYGLLGLMIIFAVQMLLCFKAKKIWVKLIPVYIVIGSLIFSFLTYTGVFGQYSAGAVSGNAIVGFIFAFVTVVSAIGVLPAWIIYWIMKKDKSK